MLASSPFPLRLADQLFLEEAGESCWGAEGGTLSAETHQQREPHLLPLAPRWATLPKRYGLLAKVLFLETSEINPKPFLRVFSQVGGKTLLGTVQK